MMNDIRTAAACATAALTLCAPAAHAQTYTSYDTFSASVIAPQKWLWPERQRQVTGGVLQMQQRDWGMQLGDEGNSADSWALPLRQDPARVTQMRATMSVKAYKVTGCTANPAPTNVQARVIGGFFNAGAMAPSSRIDDIVAGARLFRASNSTDAPDSLKVEGFVVRCTSEDCKSTVPIGLVDLGRTTVGGTVTLSVEWDRANRRFAFRNGSGARQFVAYVENDQNPAFATFREIGTRTSTAHCLSGPRTEAFVRATFDNVAVNASAAR